jgi:excisionase family DNA binding protein
MTQGAAKTADDDLSVVAGGLLKIAEAANLAALSKSKIYLLLNDGTLPSVRVGRTRRIPRNALLRYLKSQICASTTEGAARG